MGRPRKSVRAQSFSIDEKMHRILVKLAEKKGCTLSHLVNMALYEYQPIKDMDTYRGYWECDQRDCKALNPPKAKKCKECGWKALWVIEKEHNDRILKYK